MVTVKLRCRTICEAQARLKEGFSNLQTADYVVSARSYLLSNCYCHKVNYLMRTTLYRLMEPFWPFLAERSLLLL
jgi:hypothetical protein